MIPGLDVSLSADQGVLRVTLAGAFPRQWEESVGVFAKLTIRAREFGCSRVLADVRGLTDRPGINDTFAFSVLSHSEEHAQTKTATLDLLENAQASHFYERLMQSRGRRFRAFFDEGEALAWLLDDEG